MESRAISQTGRATPLPSPPFPPSWTADRKPQKQANPSGTNNIPNCHRTPRPPLTGKSQLMNTFELVNSRPTEHTPNISWGWFSHFVSSLPLPLARSCLVCCSCSGSACARVQLWSSSKGIRFVCPPLGERLTFIRILAVPQTERGGEGGGRGWSVLEACNKFWLESFLWHRQEMPHIKSATRFVSVCWFSFAQRGSARFALVQLGSVSLKLACRMCVGGSAGGCFCGRFASLKAICRAELKSELATRHAHWLCQLHETVDGKVNEKDDELQE